MYVCIAILTNCKDALEELDQSEAKSMLFSLPPLDVDRVSVALIRCKLITDIVALLRYSMKPSTSVSLTVSLKSRKAEVANRYTRFSLFISVTQCIEEQTKVTCNVQRELLQMD